MIGALIHLSILLLVLLVVWFLVKVVAAHFQLPYVAVQVVGAIIGLIFLLYALQLFGVANLGRIP